MVPAKQGNLYFFGHLVADGHAFDVKVLQRELERTAGGYLTFLYFNTAFRGERLTNAMNGDGAGHNNFVGTVFGKVKLVEI